MKCAYILPGLKFRAGEGKAIGIGYQVGASNDREYETQTLITVGLVF